MEVLTLAIEEAERLSHPHVATEHLLVGLLLAEGSLAAKLLQDRGVKLEKVRAELAKVPGTAIIEELRPSRVALQVLETFLGAIKNAPATEISAFFTTNAQFIDCNGKRWAGFKEIDTNVQVLFAPYAKKNVRFVVESRDLDPSGFVIASVLWENVTVVGESRRSTHRMSVILARHRNNWAISFVQVTPVVVG